MMRGRPFEPGNTVGRGRPPGSPNKKGLMLERALLEKGDKILKTLMDRAMKGDRAALALCIERLYSAFKRPGGVARRFPIHHKPAQGGPHT
jgi:hypothetical protein